MSRGCYVHDCSIHGDRVLLVSLAYLPVRIVVLKQEQLKLMQRRMALGVAKLIRAVQMLVDLDVGHL